MSSPTPRRKWAKPHIPGLRRPQERHCASRTPTSVPHLADEGTFATLGTTQPSESPVAWASFATGVNPGKHNIYDFLIRDFDTYLPDFTMVKKEPPEFLWGSSRSRGRKPSPRAEGRPSGSPPASTG